MSEDIKTGSGELTELLKAGVHFGHHTSRWNPKMQPFIFASREKVHIIDLAQTNARLKEADKFIHSIMAKKGTILFVGTKRQAKEIVKEEALRCEMPYVTERWLGGTLTNFSTILSRTKRLKDLEKGLAEGELDKYTKKERLSFQREADKLNATMGGVKELKNLPEALYITDVKEEKIAVREAQRKGILIIAIVDTNVDPSSIDFPIPANDDAVSSISLITKRISQAIIDGRKAEENTEAKETKEDKKDKKNTKK